MKQGFLVPIYKHVQTAIPLAEKLSVFRLPVILVDDGNDSGDKELLAQKTAGMPGIFIVSLFKNRGKGGAFAKGIEKAAELELTHVLQIDADGQHDIDKVSFFLEEAEKHPDKIICGYPLFDDSAPKSRVKGRKISNFWASLVTLSNEMTDVMCGFRVYPVEAALHIIKYFFIDNRMGFDAEILVRLYWKKVFPVFHPIKINYPKDGISNFRIVRDNIRISWTFTRLFFGMMIRFPFLLSLRIKRGKEK